MGATHFPMRNLRNVSTEIALDVLACNMKHVALVGVGALAAMIIEPERSEPADGGKPPGRLRQRRKTDSERFCRVIDRKRALLTRHHTASAFHTAWAWPTSSSVWSVSTPGARGQVVRPKPPIDMDLSVGPQGLLCKSL